MFQKLWAKAKALYLRRTSSSYYEQTFKDGKGNEFKRVIRDGVVVEDNFGTMTKEQREQHSSFKGDFDDLFANVKGEK